MSEKTYIYGLLCPVENKIRYIGQSVDPVRRYREHAGLQDVARYVKQGTSKTSMSTKQEWIASLLERGLKPGLVILEEVISAPETWIIVERQWIERFLVSGHPLTNAGHTLKDRQIEDKRIFEEAVDRGRNIMEALGIDPSELIS